MTWRDKARPIIAAVIASHPSADTNSLKRALRKAYPWGPREYYPYKIWCDEVRVQLGLKPEKERAAKVKKPATVNPRQRELL